MRLTLACALLLTAFTAPASADISQRQEVRRFVDEMVSKHKFERSALTAQFARTEIKDDIIKAISKPAEGTMTWARYRNIFITPDRIRQGAEFWAENEQALERASVKYGVAPEIIVAIIGVETMYGRNTGKYRVMDALATLAFAYPPRASFFRSELENFLIMAREERVDPLSLMGSYAGAMGEPQFMPSSFRSYAVDFDQDGRRDLWRDRDDVIGSVANYFRAHGWVAGAPVVFPARIAPDTNTDLLVDSGIDLKRTVGGLQAAGVLLDQPLPGSSEAKFLRFEGENGLEHYVALHNFYVITRYNRSPLYAMAVHQLAERVAERHARGEDKP